jgi:hypothetical protein
LALSKFERESERVRVRAAFHSKSLQSRGRFPLSSTEQIALESLSAPQQSFQTNG